MRLPVKFLIFILGCCSPMLCTAFTLEQCLEKAEANYPLIKKYNLFDSTSEIELSDINKSWLPRIGLYAQGKVQNVVPSFPDALKGVLQQMGQEMKGLSKFQYKAGADINQTIWDGGTSKSRRELIRAQEAVSRAALDVEMYAIRQRVENIFFALLLTEEQIAQSEVTYDLLSANVEKLQAMYRNGTAMKSDVEMLEAQMLTVGQAITSARSAAESYRTMLFLYTGVPLDDNIEKPAALIPSSDESARPELRLFDKRRDMTDTALKLNDKSVMPKIGLFAQAYYGYPGFDYFHSMMSRNPSFNVLAGIKLSWNIDAFYTRHNASIRTTAEAAEIDADRETFLFNSNLSSASERDNIRGLQKIMKDDAKIISLRSEVRKAAESQLENGVIDATALLTKISDEELARLTAVYHEIKLIQAIYQLKNLLNQ